MIHYIHTPVLLQEVIENLVTDRDGTYVDCTLGGGGHAEEILQELSEKGKVIGIDQDADAIEASKKRLLSCGDRFEVIQGNFAQIEKILPDEKYSGFLFDLGVSSYQIDNAEKGFSFQKVGPLDMRMDGNGDLTAEIIINKWEIQELIRIFKEYGEERWSKRIARAIIGTRENSPIKTTKELAEIIRSVTPGYQKQKTLARIFQALRIAVNKELEILEESLKTAVDMLEKGGRIVVISYHSLEDRIVKHTFRELVKGCTCPPRIPMCVCGKEPKLKLINKKPITPTQREVHENPRSRSAKFRCAERI